MGESFATNLDADTPAISAPQSSTSEHSRDRADAASRCLIVIVAIILAWYTWASWGDIQIDCGRELYVPTEFCAANFYTAISSTHTGRWRLICALCC